MGEFAANEIQVSILAAQLLTSDLNTPISNGCSSDSECDIMDEPLLEVLEYTPEATKTPLNFLFTHFPETDLTFDSHQLH